MLQILLGDITKLKDFEAIVNAANTTLLGGGGVDGAIHRAAGPALLEECEGLGGCEPGQAKITSAYNLPCKYVIHTVGPIWSGGDFGEAETLASCYTECLELAKRKGIRTIVFPSISTGAYGYPVREAAKIALNTFRKFWQENKECFDEVGWVLFDRDTYDVYVDEVKIMTGQK